MGRGEGEWNLLMYGNTGRGGAAAWVLKIGPAPCDDSHEMESDKRVIQRGFKGYSIRLKAIGNESKGRKGGKSRRRGKISRTQRSSLIGVPL